MSALSRILFLLGLSLVAGLGTSAQVKPAMPKLVLACDLQKLNQEYVAAGGSDAARDTLQKLAEGVAMLGGGDKQHWPFGAVQPWVLSRSMWHGWGGQMPAALATPPPRAAGCLGYCVVRPWARRSVVAITTS